MLTPKLKQQFMDWYYRNDNSNRQALVEAGLLTTVENPLNGDTIYVMTDKARNRIMEPSFTI